MSIADKIQYLADLPRESEWVEFKVNNSNLETIGKNISAISNSACLHGVPKGYIVWGIENSTHKIIGTSFDPYQMKRGNEELENWIMQRLSPRIDFIIHVETIDSKLMVVFEIDAAFDQPVAFTSEAYIRVGSSTRKLKDYPDKARKIWSRTEDLAFEQRLALTGASESDVLELLDYQAYFRLRKRPLPPTISAILKVMASEDIIHSERPDKPGYSITNLGAILFANDLNKFDKMRRKAVRVITYQGRDRLNSTGEQEGSLGYAIAFERLITFIKTKVPAEEEFKGGIRTSVTKFPEDAIRELVANALIHQDLSVSGMALMIEIFSDRLEITNPGIPLIDTLDFINHTPVSRNERIVLLMRQIGICEQRGSGIARVIKEIEKHQLPAPSFVAGDEYLRATLYGPSI